MSKNQWLDTSVKKHGFSAFFVAVFLLLFFFLIKVFYFIRGSNTPKKMTEEGERG